MEDYLEDEMKIMDEQDSEATAISADAFQKPLSELATKNVFSIDVSSTIGEAIKIMQERKFGSVLITKDKKLAGIFTERDVLNKVVGKLPDYENRPLSEVMTEDPVALREDDMIAYALNNMHVGGYRHVPIVNEKEEPVSIVSVKDVVAFVLDQFPKEITNSLSQPYRGKHTREGA
jgi:CBS domain-containing protein